MTTVYTVCHSQHSDQRLHNFPFSADSSRSKSTMSFSGTVWSASTLFAILSSLSWSKLLGILRNLIKIKDHTVILRYSLIRFYTFCHSQQSDQCLQCLPFSAVWSVSTPFAILSLIRVYTICHSQQSHQGLHYLPFFLSSIIKVSTVCHSQQSDQGLYYLPFSAVWSGSSLFTFLSRLITTLCYSQSYQVCSVCYSQFEQGLQCLPFSAVWSESTLLAILSSLIKVKVYTVILRNSLIRVYTTCQFQHFDQDLHYLPFIIWSGSTIFAILSMIRVNTICHSQ